MPIDTTVIEELVEASFTDEVELEDLTQVNLENGAGAFDVLMRALEQHLAKEHAANRITGDQYAATYTSLVATVLQQSIAFLLGAEKLKLERNLTALQLLKLQKEIDLLCQRLVTEKAQVMDSTILDPTATEETSFTNEANESYHNTIQEIEGLTGRKNAIMIRQQAGYDDDYKTKVGRLVLDAYKIIFSNVNETDAFPEELKNPGIDQLIEHLKIDSLIVNDRSSDTTTVSGGDKDGYIENDKLKYESQDVPTP